MEIVGRVIPATEEKMPFKQGIAVSVVFFDIHCFSFEKVSTNNQGIIDSDSNNNTYTTYFLKSAQDAGVAPITQEVTSSVFALNYDLFIANFNSLNKRMGDLRNNPYSQGAWGRIFNGQLSNDFGRGLYSDSIAKFSYLISDFNLTNNGASEKLSVNNYAFQLSKEVGYVFTLGGNKEWSITPQAELSFGYYSDSDLTQVTGDFYLDAKAKSLMMLRTRVGTTVGYDFKQFTQGKGVNASLYAGLSYQYRS